MGDFNDILHVDEKKGRATRLNFLIRGFRQAPQDVGLIDVHMEGYPFHWFKSLGITRVVEEKMDRALVNNSWMQMFPNAKLENLLILPLITFLSCWIKLWWLELIELKGPSSSKMLGESKMV